MHNQSDDLATNIQVFINNFQQMLDTYKNASQTQMTTQEISSLQNRLHCTYICSKHALNIAGRSDRNKPTADRREQTWLRLEHPQLELTQEIKDTLSQRPWGPPNVDPPAADRQAVTNYLVHLVMDGVIEDEDGGSGLGPW